MGESYNSESQIKEGYSFSKTILTEYRKNGGIIDAFCYGSLVQTPGPPGDVDILVLLKSDDLALRQKIGIDLEVQPAVQASFTHPQELKENLNPTPYQRWKIVSADNYYLGKLAGRTKKPRLAEIIRMLGARAAVVSRALTPEYRLKEFRQSLEDLDLSGENGLTQVSGTASALEFIDRLITDRIDDFDGSLKGLPFDRKLAKTYDHLKSRIDQRGWKRIVRLIGDISDGTSLEESIFAQGVINLDDKKIGRSEIEKLLSQVL